MPWTEIDFVEDVKKRIDAFQETYFVIDSFQQLYDATAPDFTPLYRELATLPDLAANATLPEDRLVPLAG